MRNLELAVKYLAGDRLIGTAAERAALTTQVSDLKQNSWKEIGRFETSSASDEIDVVGLSNTTSGTLATKDNLMILVYLPTCGSSSAKAYIRFNDDDSSNYKYARVDNGGSGDADAYENDSSNGIHVSNNTMNNGMFAVVTGTNRLNEEKIFHTESIQVGSTGAQNAPARTEAMSAWTENAQINKVTLRHTDGTNTFPSGSVVVVLGCDDDEADSGTNFWQELYATTTTEELGSITTTNTCNKKFMMCDIMSWQGTYGSGNSGFRPRFRCNSETGKQWGSRYSNAGGNATEEDHYAHLGEADGEDGFHAKFFVCQFGGSAKEKFFIIHSSRKGCTDATCSPQRYEAVTKWEKNNQSIHTFVFGGYANFSSMPFATGTVIRVWGSD